MPADQPIIQFGSLDGALYIDVQGRPTQRVAPTVARVVEDFLTAQSGEVSCVVDLNGAEWVDSTFAGCLIAMFKQVSRRGGRLQLNNCGAECQKSLARMHLEHVAEYTTAAAPGGLQALACATGDRPTAAEVKLMLAAHQELCAVNEHNERIFGPVVEMLQKQLEQATD